MDQYTHNMITYLKINFYQIHAEQNMELYDISKWSSI